VTAGFDREERDVKTGLGIVSNLGVIWDRCGTVRQRRQFAKLLFSRVTIDGNSRLRGWALSNPFQQLFEFAQPGSKLVLSGVPNRTSFELHLPAEMGVLYSAAEPQRTLSGRSADAQRTVSGRSADACLIRGCPIGACPCSERRVRGVRENELPLSAEAGLADPFGEGVGHRRDRDHFVKSRLN